jgi:hypothetical protein
MDKTLQRELDIRKKVYQVFLLASKMPETLICNPPCIFTGSQEDINQHECFYESIEGKTILSFVNDFATIHKINDVLVEEVDALKLALGKKENSLESLDEECRELKDRLQKELEKSKVSGPK